MHKQVKHFWKLALGLLFIYILFLLVTNLSLFPFFLSPDKNIPLPVEDTNYPSLPTNDSLLPISSPSSPSSTSTTPLFNMTLPSATSYLSCAESSTTQKIYCFGGFLDPLNTFSIISEFDSRSSTDKVISVEMPHPADYLSCTKSSITHTLYCFGGRDKDVFYSEIFEYRPLQNVLLNKTTMPLGRAHFSCTESSATHKIYCFGGSSDKLYDEILMYDPLINSVKIMRSRLPTPRYQVSCANSALTQKIYCFGGAENDAKGHARRIDLVLEYDPVTDIAKTTRARLPTPRRLLSCVEQSTTHNIYCFGGDDAQGGFYDDIIRYDPLSDSLAIVAHLPENRTGMSCAEDSPSSLYCFGGINQNGIILDSIFKFTPSKGLFKRFPS